MLGSKKPGAILRTIVGAAVAANFIGNAAAQESPAIPALDVVADVIADTECAVSENALVAAAKAALRYNRIDFKSGSDFYLYVNVNAIQTSVSNCAASLGVSVKSVRYVPIASFQTTDGFFPVTMCERGYLINWSRNELGNQLNTAIKDYTDQCLADILDNE